MAGNFASPWEHETYGAIEPPVHGLEELEDGLQSAATQRGDLSQTLAPATFESHESSLLLLSGVPWNPSSALPSVGSRNLIGTYDPYGCTGAAYAYPDDWMQSTLFEDALPYSPTQEPLASKVNDEVEVHAAELDGSDSARTRESFVCDVSGCSMTFDYEHELHRHQESPHTSKHSIISKSPFVCKCDQEFTTLYTLKRHIQKFQDITPEFRCEDCKKVFKRQDNLVQHLRHFHKLQDAEIATRFPAPKNIKNTIPVCHLTGCGYYRDDSFTAQPLLVRQKDAPFAKQSDYTEHMRGKHNWSPYPCTIALCNKVKKNGYFNEKSLQRHLQKKHPDAEPLVIKPREVKRIPCGAPGCTKLLRPASLRYHRSFCATWRESQRGEIEM